MTPIADITSAMGALRAYLAYAQGKLPAATLDQFTKLVDSPSPVDAIVRSAELLYARPTEIDDTGRTLVAQLASFAATNGWHGMSIDNRGGRIWQAMNREIGTPVAAGQSPYPDASADPEPSPEYVVAADPDRSPAPAA